MDLVELLSAFQIAVFVSLAGTAVIVALRRRTRPPVYLAAAFAAIATSLAISLLVPDPRPESLTVLQVLSVAALAGYPWLLAGFAWSFGGPLPVVLRLAALLPVALTIGYVVVGPMPDEGTTFAQDLYVGLFVAAWAALSAAMAVRLWRAGTRQRLVRARMRLMASGAVALTLALFLGVLLSTDSETVGALVNVIVLTAAMLFAAGFAPPAPLRMWWRRQASHEFQRMQVALITALTPKETATVVAPLLAELLGGGVAVLEASGFPVAWAELSEAEAARLARDHRKGRADPRTLTLDIGERTLLLRTTPYTPVFGAEEHELLEGFALQMRLALERAELYQTAERARQEAEAARTELEGTLVGLAHDLKSPTLAISGFAGLLHHEQDPDEHAEMVSHIEASSVYLRGLVEALVEVSRVGHTQTEASDVDLREICGAVIRRVRGTHPAARVAVEGVLPVVRMNVVRSEQMIDNLVGNAVRHGGREDLHVTIVGRHHDDGSLTIEVADDGRGIDPEDRERIFNLFQRGRSPAEKGSGVGLGMVRRIAQAYGGTLTLGTSEVGARFLVHLPPEVVVANDDTPPQGEPIQAEGRPDPATAETPASSGDG